MSALRWTPLLGPEPAAIDCSAIRARLTRPDLYEVERRAGQAQVNSLFAAHEARIRAAQEERWSCEEAEGEALVARMNMEGGRG